jgi:hypothetical protein
MNTLGERIAKAMASTPGKTQAGLARACGIRPPSVSGWLTGKSKSIDGTNLIKASEYLGVRSKWLATGLGPMTTIEPVGLLPLQEEQKVYKINAWPFKTITPSNWEKLTDSQKMAVESVISSCINTKPNETVKTKAR